ncbi:ORF52 [Duck adenovirus 2]|uniref:ORF52 n=1 Tax=Duck adenovirus 2 TaxID=1520006 RepID=A0A075FA54_9ADEN|nr:ORF52 [Duck adenovirus 2]AIE77209.1 ORF52 [Duck adenovirus 2]
MSNTHPVYIQLTTHSYRINDRLVRNGPLLDLCGNDSIIPMSVAYALARWACTPDCNYLYLAGPVGSGADALLNCLMQSLRGAPDVKFSINYPITSYPFKQVIRVVDLNVQVTTYWHERSIIQFVNQYVGDIPTPKQLGAFILAVGNHKGPSAVFRCQNPDGIICHNEDVKCTVCSLPMWEFCPFMIDIDYDVEDDSEDEGIVCV